MKKWLSLIMLLAVNSVAPSAFALNYGFLANTPISKFTEQDMELLKSHVRQALDEAENGQTLEWSNPETSAQGTITVESSQQDGDRYCRVLAVTNKSKYLQGGGKFKLCKNSTGAWSLIGTPED